MTTEIIAFGVVKDILGGNMVSIDTEETLTVGSLKTLLEQKYPGLKELASLMIAVNSGYAQPGDAINPGDEVALIPPVSGG